MTDPSNRPGRVHPFGRVANALVHAGATLGVAQALVFVVAWGTSPLWGPGRLGPVRSVAGLLIFVVLTVGVGVLAGWLSWRALSAWRARSTRALGRLLVAAVVLLPLGPLLLDAGAPLFSLAGLLLALAALLSRRRIVTAEREGTHDRDGPVA